MKIVRSLQLAPEQINAGPGDGRTVTVRVVTWGRQYRVSDDGRTFYRERFPAGGLTMRAGAEITATAEHDARLLRPGLVAKPAAGRVVGRVAATHVRADGLDAEVRVFDSIDGDQLLDDIRNGRTPLYVSAEFDADEVHPAPGELVDRAGAELVGLAFTTTPQYDDSRVLSVRSTNQPQPGDPAMHEETETDESAGTDTPDTNSDDTSGAPTPPAAPATQPAAAPVTRSAPVPGRRTPPTSDSRQAHFRSFGHFAHDVAHGRVAPELRQRFARALATATTADATGLMPEQWVSTVIDLYRTLTPTVQAFDQQPLPDTGEVINQPIVSQRPTVNKQTAQLAELASQKAIIVPASWTVDTYGGGNNVSLQTIRRSQPSYLDALYRLWVREMALDINGDAAAGVLAAASAGPNTDLEFVDYAGFDELVIDASATFLSTLYRPAEVALLSVDLWAGLAKAKDADDHPLYPSINPTNRSGTMSATQTDGSIVQVAWYVEPALGVVGDGNSAVIGVRDAYRTMTGPMETLSADVPSNLSQDHAVFQFAAMGAVDASGLVAVVDLV